MMRDVDILNEVACAAASSPDQDKALRAALRVLARALDMRYATLALLDVRAGVISYDLSDGLTDEQRRRGHYSLGEGVTGQVAATGEPAIVPSIQDCPRFLNRTGIRTQDASFICVPVILGSETLGTISMDGDPASEADLHGRARVLGIAASMLAQTIRTRMLLRERQESLAQENTRLRAELRRCSAPKNIIGACREMQQLYAQIDQAAASQATVLIQGETGTGKEVVARALHYQSARADKPFVSVNCAALPESLIESELFGHERGAFTGAGARRLGRFELADGGTIFLDEIGDLPQLMQAKLLRVLQEREFERVGGDRTLTVDVRVIAATNRDLYAMTMDGSFRGDLFYRINVFPIYLLPLRKRISDLPLLAEHFLHQYAAREKKRVVRFAPDVLRAFTAYTWPGNIRELENCIERAVIVADGETIALDHLPAPFQAAATGAAQDYQTRVDNFERDILGRALRAAGGNVRKAAAQLGATPRVIGYRAKKLGLLTSSE